MTMTQGANFVPAAQARRNDLPTRPPTAQSAAGRTITTQVSPLTSAPLNAQNSAHSNVHTRSNLPARPVRQTSPLDGRDQYQLPNPNQRRSPTNLMHPPPVATNAQPFDGSFSTLSRPLPTTQPFDGSFAALSQPLNRSQSGFFKPGSESPDAYAQRGNLFPAVRDSAYFPSPTSSQGSSPTAPLNLRNHVPQPLNIRSNKSSHTLHATNSIPSHPPADTHEASSFSHPPSAAYSARKQDPTDRPFIASLSAPPVPALPTAPPRLPEIESDAESFIGSISDGNYFNPERSNAEPGSRSYQPRTHGTNDANDVELGGR